MQTVKNGFRIIDGGYWKLNLKDLNTLNLLRRAVLTSFHKEDTSAFLFLFAFPRFPCGCWLALARCRRGDATLSYLRVTDQICPLTHFLTGHHCVMASLFITIISHHVLEALGLSPLLSSLFSSQITLTLAAVSSLFSLSGLTTN